jgi:hypothetical protein
MVASLAERFAADVAAIVGKCPCDVGDPRFVARGDQAAGNPRRRELEMLATASWTAWTLGVSFALTACDAKLEQGLVDRYFAALRRGDPRPNEVPTLLVPGDEMEEARRVVRESRGGESHGVAGVRSKACLRVRVDAEAARNVWMVVLPDANAFVAGMSVRRECRCHGRHSFDACDFEQ